MTTAAATVHAMEEPAALRILAVDDTPTSLMLLVKMLERQGFEITTATNGVEAMKLLHGDPEGFDIILLDRMMPEMDGIEVTRQVKADPRLKYIPIIMQTAADNPDQISEGIKAGVFYYLTKPLTRRTLLSVVSAAAKQVLQHKQLRAEMKRHRMSFDLIQINKAVFRTLEEAESLASFLANCFPDSERALNGISELLINAVEHGNLEVSYEEKSRLMEQDIWRQEIDRRLADPRYRDRRVEVIFERRPDACYIQITDQGPGFNWKNYLQVDPSRAQHNHGRGIAMANKISFDRLIYNERGNQVIGVMHAAAADQDDYWR